MARTPATHNDAQITRMLKAGNSVAAIASELAVSEPTVYNAIRRLGLTLPSRSKATSSAVTSPRTKPAASGTTAKRPPATGPATATATAKRSARTPRSAPVRSADPSIADDSAATSKQSTPGTGLVPVGSAPDLLTVRVDKGIELLKNLSARIVRHERELAAARLRYAETLASLALS